MSVRSTAVALVVLLTLAFSVTTSTQDQKPPDAEKKDVVEPPPLPPDATIKQTVRIAQGLLTLM
jgi:hypothetical protein